MPGDIFRNTNTPDQMGLTFGKWGLRFSLWCKEGDIMMVNSTRVGGTENVPTFTHQLRNGNWVKLVRGATEADDEVLTVELATAQDLNPTNPLGATDPRLVIGKLISEPRFIGYEPNKDTVYGEYACRSADIETIGDYAKDYFVKEGNANAIRPGDSVAIVDAWFRDEIDEVEEVVEKSARYNGSIALTGCKAGSDGRSRVRVLHVTKSIGE